MEKALKSFFFIFFFHFSKQQQQKNLEFLESFDLNRKIECKWARRPKEKRNKQKPKTKEKT